MITYDYYCENCKAIKEVRHRIDKDPIIKCDNCGEVMKRLILGGDLIQIWGEGKCHYITESNRGKHIDH